MTSTGTANGTLTYLAYPTISQHNITIVGKIQTNGGRVFDVEQDVWAPKLPGDRGVIVNFDYQGQYVTRIQELPQTHKGTFEAVAMPYMHRRTQEWIGGLIKTKKGETFHVRNNDALANASRNGSSVFFKPTESGSIAENLKF